MKIVSIAKSVWLMLVCIALTACGPDMLGAAATGAATKKQELEQARAAQQKATEQLQHTLEQVKQRNDQAEQNSQ